MTLSIVIPVYNVEFFIHKCLDSIYSQGMDENWFEVIVVNDGTLDKSMDVVAQFNSHRNLLIINQENKGLSIARNNGLEQSNGQYIWFVDSDDWLENDSLKTVKEYIEKCSNVDVFASVLMMYYERNGKRCVEYKPNFKVQNGQDYMFRNHNANRGACQRYIFKRSFLEEHHLRFMPGVYHEDGEFSNRMLYLAKSMKILPKPLYDYRIRESGSIMSSRNMKANYDLVKIYFSLLDFAEQYVKGHSNYWRYRYVAYECLEDTIIFSKREIFNHEFDDFYRVNKQLIKDEARELLRHSRSLTIPQIYTTFKFAFAPKLATQLRQGVKRILEKIRLMR